MKVNFRLLAAAGLVFLTGTALAQTSMNFQLVGQNPLFNRGMNAAATIFQNFLYVGNRSDGSSRCGFGDPRRTDPNFGLDTCPQCTSRHFDTQYHRSGEPHGSRRDFRAAEHVQQACRNYLTRTTCMAPRKVANHDEFPLQFGDSRLPTHDRHYLSLRYQVLQLEEPDESAVHFALRAYVTGGSAGETARDVPMGRPE